MTISHGFVFLLVTLYGTLAQSTNPKVSCEQQITATTIPDPPDVSNHPNLGLVNSDTCGLATDQNLFAGNQTNVFEFPWMALIAYDTGFLLPKFICAGSLINKRYVLTAGHCVASLPNGITMTGVRIGEHDLSRERDCNIDQAGVEIACAEGYQDIGLESIHYHPEFSNTKKQGDIALIRLNADADFRPKNARPICLPIGSAATMTCKKVTVTGWGLMDHNVRSDKLLQVQLDLINTEDCARAHNGTVQIWHKQICAGGKRGMDACGGDSGAPLQAPAVYKNKVRFIQYGLASFGLANCDTAGVPGVYTNVAYYMNWILDTIRP